MKKIVLAVLAVAGIGAAALGAVRISNGCCPLTGRPIHCGMHAPDAAVATYGTASGEASAQNVSAQTLAQDGSTTQQSPCCMRHRAQCCAEKAKCCQEKNEAAKPVETPAPTTNP